MSQTVPLCLLAFEQQVSEAAVDTKSLTKTLVGVIAEVRQLPFSSLIMPCIVYAPRTT